MHCLFVLVTLAFTACRACAREGATEIEIDSKQMDRGRRSIKHCFYLLLLLLIIVLVTLACTACLACASVSATKTTRECGQAA